MNVISPSNGILLASVVVGLKVMVYGPFTYGKNRVQQMFRTEVCRGMREGLSRVCRIAADCLILRPVKGR